MNSTEYSLLTGFGIFLKLETAHESLGVIGSTEDMIEIDFADGKVSRVGDQYGVGRVVRSSTN
jgi:hypothetical protein